jgi:hypothetical protein
LAVATLGTRHEVCTGVRPYLLLGFLTGCLLDPVLDRGGDDEGVDDGDGTAITHHCETYTATIFEPANEATVAPDDVVIRVRWNEAGIPDRYMSLSDDYGNYFPFGTGSEILGDGSIVDHYMLPAGGAFNLEIGWFCDAGNDGPEVKLASVRFYTSP